MQSHRRRGAATFALALLAVGCGGGNAVPVPAPDPPDYQPKQAVLYDGSPAASATLVMSFSAQDILLDLGAQGVPCNPGEHASPGGIVSVADGAPAVYEAASGFGDAFLTLLASLPPVLPPSIDAFEDDCDLAADFPTVQAYLAQIQADAAALLADVEVCDALAQGVYCQIVAAVDAATVVPPSPPVLSILLNQIDDPSSCLPPASPFPSGPLICDPFLYDLELLAWRAEMIDWARAGCEDALAALQDLLASIGSTITAEARESALEEADHLRARSSFQLGVAQTHGGDLDASIATFVLADIQAACAECTPDFVHLAPALSGAVMLLAGRAVLDDLTLALSRASREAHDPASAARLTQALARLQAIPAHRTHHATFRGSQRVGTHFIAVRDPRRPDDGLCPLAVVITALPVDAPLPDPNASDLALLDFALRSFADALGPRAP